MKPSAKCCQLFILLFAAAIGSPLWVHGQKPGSATSIDNGPPLTEAQQKAATQAGAKGATLQARLRLLGKAQRATIELDQTLVQHSGKIESSPSIDSKLHAWQSLANAIVTVSGEDITVDDGKLALYPKAAVDVAVAVTDAAPVSAGSSAMSLAASHKSALTVKDLLFRAYDANIFEHGKVNLTLRTFPYRAVITEQPFIECDAMNLYARDLKCLPVRSQGIVTNKDWFAAPRVNLADFCRTDQLEPFGRADYGHKEVYIRKTSSYATKLGAECRL